MKTFGSLTQAELSRWNLQTQWSLASINHPSFITQPLGTTQFDLTAHHPVPAHLGEVFPVRNLTTLQTTSKKRVAVQIRDAVEVLAGHANPRDPGPLQTINETPFLFDHRNLL